MRPHSWRLVAIATLTWFFLQAVHQFLPSIYARAIETLSVPPSAALVLLFLAPLAYLFVGSMDPSKLVLPLGLAVVALRLALAVTPGSDAILLFSGLTVATYLLYLPAHLLRAGNASAGIDATGFALGFAADATARAVYFGSDPFASPWGLVPVVLVSGIAVFSLIRDRGDPVSVPRRELERLGRRDVVRMVLLGLGLGAILALQVTLLAYPSVLARFVAVAQPAMTIAVFTGVGLGVGIVARGIRPSLAMFLLGNAILIGAVLDLALIGSAVLPLLVAIAELVIVADLSLLFRYLQRGSPTLQGAGLAFGVAGFAFIAYVFAFVLTLAYAFVPARTLWEGRLPLFLVLTALLATVSVILFAWRSRLHDIRVEGAPGAIPRVLTGAVVILLVVATLGSLVAPEPATPSSSPIVVMTYNIHQGFGQDGVLGIERIAEVIRQADADIVAIQESDTARVSSGNQDAVRFLAVRLGYHEAYGPLTRDQIFGVSILSRFPILRWETIPLPSTEAERVMVEADVQIGVQVLRVYVAHFGLLDAERAVQADFVRQITSSAPSPRILLGDFNSVPHEYCPGTECSSNVYAKLTANWRDSWTAADPPPMESAGPTWPATAPTQRIDYVFVGPGIAVDFAYVPRNRLTEVASDHLPVVVRVVLP